MPTTYKEASPNIDVEGSQNTFRSRDSHIPIVERNYAVGCAGRSIKPYLAV